MSSYENGKRTRLGRIWNNMRKRCNNERHESYKYYGAKGIKVCEEWNQFDVFKEWAMNNGYQDGLSIDRIDNNDDYKPENCKWSTSEEQGNNRNTNHIITHNGTTMSMKQWADRLGIDYKTLSRRIYAGWSIEKALFSPVEQKYSHRHSSDQETLDNE